MSSVSDDSYLPRLVDALLTDLLADSSGLLITGPRAAGKTTTAARHAASIVHLDQFAPAEQFHADPDVALAGMAEPVLLDEWQAVPGVLGAVKRAIDTAPGRGRFIVTGSVRDDLLSASWPVTGRLLRVEMTGLCVREIERRDLSSAPFLQRIGTDGPESLVAPADAPDLRGYVDRAVLGGYPEPVLRTSPGRRRRWLLSYLEQLLTRDAAAVGAARHPERLRRYFQAYALNTAAVVTDRSLYEAAGIDQKTAGAYEQLLRTLLLVDSVPAWSSNQLKRLVRGPKRFVRDPSLVAAVMDADTDVVLRDGNLLGRMIETFVLAQLQAEQPLYDHPPRMFHLRQEAGGHEVDLVVELNPRQIIGIEVRSRAGVDRAHARHLSWLRDQLGQTFHAGVVLHTGSQTYLLDDRIVAAPIASIWA